MEKVSAMKKIALFLMIVGLAVAMVACQGAVGKAGDGGATGPTGPSGPSGPPGSDGTSPLHLIGVTGLNLTAIETVNNGVDADDPAMVTVGPPTTVDLATYHSAGQETISYGEPVSNLLAATQVFDAELTGSMLKLSPKEMEPSLPFAIETFTVTIKDSDASGKVLTETSLAVRVRRNQKPAGAAEAVVDQRVGSQALAEPLEMMPPCTSTGVRPDCYIEVVFSDADTAGGMEVLKFKAVVAADDADKVEVVSYAAAPDNVLQARVVVRGLKTTQGEDGDEPVIVTITATDAGELTAQRTAEVSVDEAPRPEGTIPNRTMKQSAPAADRTLVTNLSAFFKDPEAADNAPNGGMTYMATSKDAKVASASVTDGGLVVTPNATGPTEITVTATETGGLRQTGTQTLTVTVVE